MVTNLPTQASGGTSTLSGEDEDKLFEDARSMRNLSKRLDKNFKWHV